MDISKLAGRYLGEAADRYDAEREQTARWKREQDAVREMLHSLPRGVSVLDIPVGTGRFLEFYRDCQLSATGLDVSPDMLHKAEAKARRLGYAVRLEQGDIRAIPATERSFDVVVCVRFLNWIELTAVREALAELRRVSRRYVIISASHFVPVAELGWTSAKGWRALAAQAARRFKTQIMRHRRAHRIIFHDRRALMDALSQASLNIKAAVCTEPGSRGVASFIYLMERGSNTKDEQSPSHRS